MCMSVNRNVMLRMFSGDEHPQFGLARNSWLTGAAAWHYVAAKQYILGRPPGN